MEAIPCCHCGDFFIQSPRHKNQCYCLKPECRRAKKAAWKRKKMREDPDYAFNQKLSNRKWAKANPSYWREYRLKNPEKAERNRLLQAIRNRRRKSKKAHPAALIAKVDASISSNIRPNGWFYLVPLIAKVDPLKIYIQAVSAPYR